MEEHSAAGAMGWCLGLVRVVPMGVASLPLGSSGEMHWDSRRTSSVACVLAVDHVLGVPERSQPRVPVPGQFGAMLVFYNLSYEFCHSFNADFST